MNRLVFIGDGRYVNRQNEREITNLLESDYPGLEFTAYSATEMTIDQLLDSLNRIDTRHTGVLFSRGTTRRT